MTRLDHRHFDVRVGDIKAHEGIRRRLPNQIGFLPKNEAVYRIYNAVFAAALLLMVLPLLLGISLLLLLTQGKEIFYRGPRLGRDRQVFHIIKFRTLDTRAAAQVTKDQTLPQNSGLETPMGKFLRDTRLDELPQLMNVLFGDMNLCGPRPVRPEIAAIERIRIPRYDVRFSVKPGLVGPAQALMSHGTSKRIRALYNNIACRRPVSLRAEIALLVAIAWSVLTRTAVNGLIVLALTITAWLRATFHAMRRVYHRAVGIGQLPAVTVTDLATVEGDLDVSRITGETIVVPGLTLGRPEQAVLEVLVGGGRMRRARVMLVPEAAPGTFRYTALSGASEYVIERYLLGLTVVRPRRGAKTDMVGEEPLAGLSRVLGRSRPRSSGEGLDVPGGLVGISG